MDSKRVYDFTDVDDDVVNQFSREIEEARRGYGTWEDLQEAKNGQKSPPEPTSDDYEASGVVSVFANQPKAGDWIEVRRSLECRHRWCETIEDGAYAVIISDLPSLAGMVNPHTVGSDGHVWFVGYPSPVGDGSYITAWLPLEEMRPLPKDERGRYCEDVERMRRTV